MLASLPKVMGTENEHPLNPTVMSPDSDEYNRARNDMLFAILSKLCTNFFSASQAPVVNELETQPVVVAREIVPRDEMRRRERFDDDTDVRGRPLRPSQTRHLDYMGRPMRYNGFMDPLGGRIYIDHNYLESCTSEATDPFALCAIESAREDLTVDEFVAMFRDDPRRPHFSKNVSDGLGAAQGAHRNFAVSGDLFGRITSWHGRVFRVYRGTPITKDAELLALFHCIEQVFTGAGIFSVDQSIGSGDPFFQISGRADFIEQFLGGQTTEKRPLINTRDEPWSRVTSRYHCISGDANRADWSKIFRMGLLNIFLGMLEDEALSWDYYALDPVSAVRDVSRDVALSRPIELETFSGQRKAMLALDLWKVLLKDMRRYISSRSVPEWCEKVVDKAEWVLDAFKNNPGELEKVLDWKIKERLIRDIAKRDPRGLHLNYHLLAGKYGKNGAPVDFFKVLRDRGEIETVITPEQIALFRNEPPADTRAYFRGKFLGRYAKDVEMYNTDWSCIGLGERLRRALAGTTRMWNIDLPDPLALTKAEIGDMFSAEHSVEEVLERVGGSYESATAETERHRQVQKRGRDQDPFWR